MKRSLILLVTLLLALGLVSGCEADEGPAADEAAPPAPAVEAELDEAASELPIAEAEDGEEAAAEDLPPADDDPFAAERAELVEEGIVALGIVDEEVVEAMRAVPRHLFVPEQYRSQAYENHPLPIGYGQTISQPYIVALMTEAAGVEPGDKVLEVGTGSGYQAAVLAEVAGEVYTVEIIGALAERAQEVLDALDYENVAVRHADGYFGWPEEAPFDAIVVTAAPDHIPQPLVAQLDVGGHLIIPVGPVGGYQTLWRLTKVSEDEVRTEDLGGVTFVPLTREEREE